jgi:rRNA pseudouridine-1189 N-methylase Emg1 (Nep1/Mra1 family)
LLLKVVKEPVQSLLPEDTLKVGTSLATLSADTPAALSFDASLVNLEAYMGATLPQSRPICFAVGGMTRGTDDFADDWVDAKD